MEINKNRQKAFELYNKFRQANGVMAANGYAKKQAIICVDEMLELNIAWIDEGIQKDYPKRFDLEQTREFWQKVKEELNKL